jgi:glycine dehydrogenase
MLAGEWERPYPRTTAVYPIRGLQGRSYLSPVRRVDQAYGDRNLVCACPSPEAFADHDFTPHAPSGDGSVPPPHAGAPDDLGTTADVVGAPA